VNDATGSTTLSKSIIIVQSNPVEGQVEEFEDWYTSRHLTDVTAVPGITRAQFYRLSEAQRDGVPAPQFDYVAVYDLDVPAAEGIRNLDAARNAGMYVSPAMRSERLLHAFDLIAETP
jgi:hypothetical protein